MKLFGAALGAALLAACAGPPVKRTPRLPALRAPNRVPLVIYAPPEWVPLAPRPQVLSGRAAASFRADTNLLLAREADRALRRYFTPVEVIREWSPGFVEGKAVAAVAIERFEVLPDGAVRVELLLTLYDRAGEPIYEAMTSGESEALPARGCITPAPELAHTFREATGGALEEAFTRIVEDLDRDDPAVGL
jgi:hypothetical protein